MKKIVTSDHIKIIAILTMLIDHIGAVLIENGLLHFNNEIQMIEILSTSWGNQWYMVDFFLRIIGRISLPLFCFLLVEGFIHTKNKKKYLLRLSLFALLSEIPFDLALYGTWCYIDAQNIFFTLALGLSVLIGIKKFTKQPFIQFIIVIIGCIFAYYMHFDYDYIAILLILSFYLFRNKKTLQLLISGIIIIYETRYVFGVGIMALLLVYFYNGKKGNFKYKYLFYWIYPIHLLIFAWLSYYVIQG